LAGLAQLPADQILPTLCAADWREYFSIGLDPTVDIDGVKAYVCSVNWTAVYHELITDLEVSHISSQVSQVWELCSFCNYIKYNIVVVNVSNSLYHQKNR